MKGIARLSRSSAALILALAVIGVIVMNVVGRIEGEVALDFIKWLVMAFFAKIAIEDGAAKYAIGKSLGTGAADALIETAAESRRPRERADTPSRAQTKKIKIEELLDQAAKTDMTWRTSETRQEDPAAKTDVSPTQEVK